MSSASAVRLSPSVQKQKLKLELLRGSRLKLESLPVSVAVHEHLVRAGCMFFGTATRRTLTRLHRRRCMLCNIRVQQLHMLHGTSSGPGEGRESAIALSARPFFFFFFFLANRSRQSNARARRETKKQQGSP